MTDIVEELRKFAEDLIALDLDMRLPPSSLNPHLAADEIENLRLSLSEAIAERDAAFEMSKCECGTDEACRNLVEAHATGRREGLSEAADIADAMHNNYAASAIRAAMEKEE